MTDSKPDDRPYWHGPDADALAADIRARMAAAEVARRESARVLEIEREHLMRALGRDEP